ncbi:phosphohistidine phosphatase SixA [Aliiglaciecola lipolytica]|uniref:Phosphohistidine phosphatase n=1 Tax=Aliiglaciecola lipolytica E3 TaxID=1127673 RepID=K6YVI0_9ALTE|nr:phosphohistidine phosphatase SixA [Aliiglaciecola lipolytica]GAC15260.1 phosphohistidine phosphatase [Aliiglaciecola lipolytica E3]
MYIFVMRHGEAAPSLQNDQQRPLNESGVAQAQQCGHWLESFSKRSKKPVSHAMVSPYLRTQQTFEHVSKITNIANVNENSDIVPNGNCQVMHYFIDQFAVKNNDLTGLLLVSHMPFVSYFIDEMCDIHTSKIFSTGTIVCLDYNVDESKGYIYDSFTPD